MKKMEAMLKYLGAGVVVYALITLCSPGSNPNQPTPDAAAQDAGTNNTCCNFPSQLNVVSADQDTSRMRRGSVEPFTNAPEAVLDGPFVLTDASTDGDGATYRFYLEQAGTSCSEYIGDQDWITNVHYGAPVHGARILVPAGYTLCVDGHLETGGNYQPVAWAGFTPY